MIELLRIRDLAIVEDVEFELGPGLNVLTGETGAGKSLILGALGLLAGGRASADQVREGAETASVEAIFRTQQLSELEADLSERGLEYADHQLVVRRSLSRNARSRAQIAGQLVPVTQLAELFSGRLEISSQHESQGLLRTDTHGRLLDGFGGLLELRDAVIGSAEALAGCQRASAELRAAAEERARRQDFLAFQVREIDEAKIQPREWEQLEAERTRLLHAEQLRTDSASAAALLAGDPAQSDVPGAGDLLAEATQHVVALARIDPELNELAERLQAFHAELRDAAGQLERYADHIDADAERLAEIEARLDQLERLRRKYGASEDEIARFRARAVSELAEAEGAEERAAELDRERRRIGADLVRDAAQLSAGRRKAAAELGAAVEAELEQLALPQAGFEVSLEAAPAPKGAPCGRTGHELAEFRFCANRGDRPRPLRKVASGGELSRLFLALKNVLRRAEPGMVVVFDEVDTGIGGRIADRVGRAVWELARRHQVLCITHLPQIAALGDVHFRVQKTTSERGSRVQVCPLTPGERVEEIARMAGGERITQATRRHARELLHARPSSSS